MKRIIIITGIVIGLLIFGGGGYWIGYGNGKNIGHNEGYISGNVTGYEKGYVSGYDNGKEFVVTHLDQYVAIPKAVPYEEVVTFLAEDQVDKNEFVNLYFDCVSFTKALRDNALKKGIKCGIVTFTLESTVDDSVMGHAINAFETTNRGIVYFDPQTDGERFGIEVGGYYSLPERYKIIKVDVIW